MRIVALLVLAGLGCDSRIESAPIQRPSDSPGSLSGTVLFTGKLATHAHWEDWPPHIDRTMASSLIVNKEGGLANVFVTITSGLSGESPDIPSKLHQLVQEGQIYDPRVLGVMKGQPLAIRNKDDALHNFHMESRRNAGINMGQDRGDATVIKFTNPELGIRVRCDIHPWMVAWIHVTEHPYFSVTGSDGRYSIPSLPPGDYELLAWHERFPAAPLKAKVKVGASMAATLDFTFEAPKK